MNYFLLTAKQWLKIKTTEIYMLIKLLTISLLFSISGCGFHPHGQDDHNHEKHKIYISTPDPYGPLETAVRKSLRMKNYKIVRDDCDENTLTIRFLDSQMDESVAAVYPNGKEAMNEKIMRVAVKFSLPGHSDKIINISNSTLSTYRMSDKNGAILAINTGDEFYKKALTSKAADDIARELSLYEYKSLNKML